MRIVEAYLGEYASGKSENSVNRALELKKAGRSVTLVDLDLVEPVYTLRSLAKSLEESGVDVLAWRTEDTVGLGEAGQVLLPAARWVLKRPGDIVFDIGYGAGGARVLNLVEGAQSDPDLRLLLIANFSRPLLTEVNDLVDYARQLGKVDALVANTHLDEETTPEVVTEGLIKTREAAEALAIPIEAVAVSEGFLRRYPHFAPDGQWITVKGEKYRLRVLRRYLPQAFW